jgi:hypothetical protein
MAEVILAVHIMGMELSITHPRDDTIGFSIGPHRRALCPYQGTSSALSGHPSTLILSRFPPLSCFSSHCLHTTHVYDFFPTLLGSLLTTHFSHPCVPIPAQAALFRAHVRFFAVVSCLFTQSQREAVGIDGLACKFSPSLYISLFFRMRLALFGVWLLLDTWPAYCSILKLEAICSSETSFDVHRTMQHYIAEDGTFHLIIIICHTFSTELTKRNIFFRTFLMKLQRGNSDK